MAKLNYNGELKPFAQELRRNMTPQERHLWYDFLRNLPLQVRRQKQFGNYIVDFYCSSANLVIEVDGSGHYEIDRHNNDISRDEYLESLGLKVVRISNLDIDRNFKGVCAYILQLAGLAGD